MSGILEKYLPQAAVSAAFELIKTHNVHLKIVNERVTRHGDYRKMPNGQHKITVNASLNKYRFLITLVHEIAHLAAFAKYGRFIKPHGLEWKKNLSNVDVAFFAARGFSESIVALVGKTLQKPESFKRYGCFVGIGLKTV